MRTRSLTGRFAKEGAATLRFEQYVERIPLVDCWLWSGANKPKGSRMGSIEGTLASVDFYYRKPAIRLVERKTLASIPCELTPELAKDFQSERIAAVWNHRRVMVRGLIYYNKTGRVLRVVATEARLIDPREVSLEEIQDASFTGGLSSLEYLSTLRDGDRC